LNFPQTKRLPDAEVDELERRGAAGGSISFICRQSIQA